jgi:hypothetical protein
MAAFTMAGNYGFESWQQFVAIGKPCDIDFRDSRVCPEPGDYGCTEPAPTMVSADWKVHR